MPTAHPHDIIGRLELVDELGTPHRVTIRREDLTTTNDGYRAIRDTITDALADVFELNRSTPLEDRVRVPAVYRYRVEFDYDSDPVGQWAGQDVFVEEMDEDEREAWLDPSQWTSHMVIQEERCASCGEWHETDSVGGFDRHESHYFDMSDGGPLEEGTYSLEELPEYVSEHFSEE